MMFSNQFQVKCESLLYSIELDEYTDIASQQQFSELIQ